MKQALRSRDPVVQHAVTGDRAAIAQVLQEHGPMVYGLCHRLSVHPEDAYQEIWEKVLKALPSFDPTGAASLKTWIATIAHRHLVDRHRRRKVRGEVLPIGELQSAATKPDDALQRHQQIARLEAAIARLPATQRRIVVLHHLHDMPLQDLAAQEGLPVGTVKSRLHRARARLAQWMGGSK